MKHFLFTLILSTVGFGQTIPFERSNSTITITASVHGQQGIFIVDTGATRTIVSQKLTGLTNKQLASASKTQANNSILGTNKSIPLASVSLKVGNTSFSNAYVWVTDVKGADGIIGLDLLSRFRSVTLNFENKTITFE